MSTGAEETRRPSHSPGVRDRGSRDDAPRGTPCLRRRSCVQRSACDPPHRQGAAFHCDELGHGNARGRGACMALHLACGKLFEILVGLAHELVRTDPTSERRAMVPDDKWLYAIRRSPEQLLREHRRRGQGHAAIIADTWLA